MLFKPGFLLQRINPGKKRREILVGTASKETIIHNTKNMKAKTKGNSTVQQNCISWSNLIRGKEALTHINANMKRQDLKPKARPEIAPSKSILSMLKIDWNGSK